jgi:membrane protein DedA with SNARE-associated domain
MPLLPFVLASLVGRGGRFFLVAALMRWGGPRIAAMEEAWMERIGWSVVVLAIGIGIAVAAT